MGAFTTINDPSKYFQVFTYTGNGSHPRNLTNDGNSDLKPDLIWTKNLSDNGTNHVLANSTMGFDAPNSPSAGGQLATDSSSGVNVPNATYGYVSAALTDGFTAAAGGTNGDTANANAKEFVAWQWKANGGTTSSNTDGNITATVQANPTAGFSIVFYTGNGTQTGKTVGHGLGAVPKMIISKDRDGTSNVATWRCYHQDIGNTKYLQMPQNDAAATYNDWDNTTPTSSVYSVGGAGGYTPTNTNNTEYIAYVFAEVQGFSKIGRYTGNNNADGPYVYCGFKPAWIMVKKTSATGDWRCWDHRRIENGLTRRIRLNATDDQDSGYDHLEIKSDGFKLRSTSSSSNSLGDFIFLAFAEEPFVTGTGVPTTAS